MDHRLGLHRHPAIAAMEMAFRIGQAGPFSDHDDRIHQMSGFLREREQTVREDGGGRARFDKQGNVVARDICPICVGYDHRVIDGADGARFTVRLVEIFENFEAAFLGF